MLVCFGFRPNPFRAIVARSGTGQGCLAGAVPGARGRGSCGMAADASGGAVFGPDEDARCAPYRGEGMGQAREAEAGGRCTIGVDIGTFESKGVLVDASGRVLAQAARPHKMLVPAPGWAEHRPEADWWGDLAAITRELVARSEVPAARVDALAVSAIGPCMVALDEAGVPLMNSILYGVDTRAAREIESLSARLGAETILARGGNALTAQSVGPKILWFRRNRPELFARCARIGSATSYLVHRLTGEWVIDPHTAAGFSPVYDAGTGDWAPDMAEGIVDTGWLPRLLWPTEIAGRITPEAAAECGLAAGTPVTCGTIDAVAEAVSVGVTGPGDMMMMYGSTMFMIRVGDRRTHDPRLWYGPWIFPGEHAAMGGLATSGTLTHWFRDHFARDLPRESAFATLAREAEASPPGARGLILLPYFSGERTPLHDPAARGVFFGLNLTHGRGDLYRALIEGIAAASTDALDAFREAGLAPGRMRAVGGGTKNALWLQATSDLGAVTQELCRQSVGAAFGDAFLAALAIGRVSRGDIAAWNPVERSVKPRRLAVYARRMEVFRALYRRNADLMAALGAEEDADGDVGAGDEAVAD